MESEFLWSMFMICNHHGLFDLIEYATDIINEKIDNKKKRNKQYTTENTSFGHIDSYRIYTNGGKKR